MTENNIEISDIFIKNILKEYAHEVDSFSYDLSCIVARENQIHSKGAFSDVEGIILYCLIRYYKPKLFFEISPDTGFSTNYILEAFGKNGSGKVIGFEIESTKHKQKKSTFEVIKENSVNSQFLDKHYKLVIGDATKNCNIEIYGKPDAVLIDSCHEKWFADWYINKLLPYVSKFSLIQDISYLHRREDSTEAQRLIEHLQNTNSKKIILDKFHKWINKNINYFPIRNYLTNSILLAGNDSRCVTDDIFPNDIISTRSILQKDSLNDFNYRKKLYRYSFPCGHSQFAPRYLAKILTFEENKFLQKKIANLMFGSLYMAQGRKKHFMYCLIILLLHLRKSKNKFYIFYTILKLILKYPILTIYSPFVLLHQKLKKE